MNDFLCARRNFLYTTKTHKYKFKYVLKCFTKILRPIDVLKKTFYCFEIPLFVIV